MSNVKTKKQNQKQKPSLGQLFSKSRAGLFRKNSIEHSLEKLGAQTEKYLIADNILPPRKHYILFSIVLFFVVFVVFANFATLDEVTRGQGKVIPSSQNKSLQSLEGGIVSEFLAYEGKKVKAGDVLLRLQDIVANSDLSANEQKYFGILASIARLEAEVNDLDEPKFPERARENAPLSVKEELAAFKANRKRMESQKLVLERQLSQREQEVKEIRTRISDTRSAMRLAQEQRDMIAPLVAKGSAPQMEVIQIDRQIQDQRTELNSLRTSLPRAESAIEEAEAKLLELGNETRAEAQRELAEKTTELGSLEESLFALKDRKDRTDIVSPVDGIIKDILINTVGGVVQPGEDIIEIVPLDENLLVEVRIRPKDIAFLYPGMPAVVKITAYDYSIYGGLKGELLDISADTIRDEEGQHFYRVRVKTNESQLKRKGEVLPIIPGMIASVDILTGEKTMMEYILKPVIKTMDSAMHER